MKPSDHHPTTKPCYLTEHSGRASSLTGTCIALLTLSLLCPAAFAQSATNFDTQKITPEEASSDQKDTAPVKEVAASDSDPSRYIGETDLEAYVHSLSSVFSIKKRATDPFGQYQDPDAKPIVKPTIARSTRRAAPSKVTPFAEIIDRIQITTIMPGERRFLVGIRSFKQGDRFPINFRGRAINVEIAAVSSRQIEFRSLENGETANLKLDLLPVGMTPGNGKITTPGMMRDRANSPLEIEPANLTI